MPAKPKIIQKPVPARRRVITSDERTTISLAEQRERKRADDKERFLVILDKHVGIISYAADEAGIPRRSIYDWMDSDPDFQRKVKDIDLKQHDFVERKLLENIKNNDTRAITFYLSTKGRHRGYTTRVEITTPADQPIRGEISVNHDESRAEMGDQALGKAMKAAMRALPAVFGDATRIAVANGDIDRKKA